ncbi:lipopolysaccharide biosynthesis protein [Flavobacterium sp. LT1R49]|uniref:lipopolysaccharide biosynthesis protein n=1 Tax=Flavobacterium arabinosi TaxID=3398737 RepID=UPI003A8AF62C
MPNTENNKRIAKNTFILYIRMFFTMGVSLYTSRVVLNTLGIEDYGVYSIVGGIVTLFSFFNSAMTSATQRFLAFDIGKNDLEKLKKTFNATLNIHIAISVLVLVLAETIGLWFVNDKLNLPIDRMVAVNWVYQFSIFTFLLGIIQVPYDALIVAREKMDIYAYMAFVEVSLKLIIVYILVISSFDKLILYAGLLFIVSFIVRMAHKQYCKWHYEESKYQFYFDKLFYKELLSYSGWSLFGNIAAVARGQGSNILLNLFFGTVLNAAYGISMQVQTTVQGFVLNFQMAVNPQIIKQYAAGNTEQCLKLIFQSAKFSYFLLFIIATPIIFNIDFILELWLKNPPRYTSVFVNLCLINLLIECISGPLMIGAQATGNIKWYQIVIGTLIFLNLPISYILLKTYKNPELIYYSSIIISLLSLVFRLFFLKNIMKFPVKDFLNNVLLRIVFVTIFVILLNHFFFQLIIIRNNMVYFFVNISIICFSAMLLIYAIGIDAEEKKAIKMVILNKIKND